MRIFHYSSHPPMIAQTGPTHLPPTVRWRAPRALADAASVIMVSVGTFAIFWMVAMVSALIML